MIAKVVNASLLIIAALITLTRQETSSYMDICQIQSMYEGWATGYDGSNCIDGNFVGLDCVTDTDAWDITIRLN